MFGLRWRARETLCNRKHDRRPCSKQTASRHGKAVGYLRRARLAVTTLLITVLQQLHCSTDPVLSHGVVGPRVRQRHGMRHRWLACHVGRVRRGGLRGGVPWAARNDGDRPCIAAVPVLLALRDFNVARLAAVNAGAEFWCRRGGPDAVA